jgi:hypothetical protein
MSKVRLSVECLPGKQREPWTCVILMLDFDLGFDHKETSQTHSDFLRHTRSEKM